MQPELVPVQVVYALPDRQAVVALQVPRGTTVSEAVVLSGLADSFATTAAAPSGAYAIHGLLVPPDRVLAAQDRVEILRNLLIDPKENRRLAATRQAAAKRSLKNR